MVIGNLQTLLPFKTDLFNGLKSLQNKLFIVKVGLELFAFIDKQLQLYND